MSAFVSNIKGLLIDPETQTITEVDVINDEHGSCLESLYDHLKCSCVDVTRGLLSYLPREPMDDIWFDDEANYSDCPYMFLIPGFVPLIGRGLILSIGDEGGCLSHTLTEQDIEYLKLSIKWFKREIEPQS